jgi:hypothetical protein
MRSLYLLFAIGTLVPTSYSPPGTIHAVIIGDSSNDALRQYTYIQTAIDDATENHPISGDPDATEMSDLPTANAAQTVNLRHTPYCFVADTDSIPYVIDTGANRVIINDAKLFHEFRPTNGKVKGIGGTPVSLNGIGTVKLPLHSDDGTVDQVILRNAVYVPLSPFNLIPPQLLIAELKHSGFHVDYFEHDDKEYIFISINLISSPPRNLTNLLYQWGTTTYSLFDPMMDTQPSSSRPRTSNLIGVCSPEQPPTSSRGNRGRL